MQLSRASARCAARIEFSSHEWFPSAREPVRSFAGPGFTYVFICTVVRLDMSEPAVKRAKVDDTAAMATLHVAGKGTGC